MSASVIRPRAHTPRSRRAPRSLGALACGAAAALVGCGGGAATPAPAATATTAAPRVAVRSACPAEAGALPSFPLTVDSTKADHLAPEVLETPKRGHCEREQHLLAQAGAKPRTASTVTSASGPVLAVHRIHAMAVLPPSRLVLLAAETGLWAHDAETMTRLARLVPHRTTDVVATPDGKYFAYVRQDAGGETPAARELVVVEAAGLGVVRRISPVPDGRMNLANDAGRVTFALGDAGVASFDVQTGRAVAFRTNDTVEDAITLPDRPDVVAYVGHDNAVAFHNLSTGAPVPQSSGGQLPLVANRDLLRVYADPEHRLLLAGGADNMLHVYEDMPGARARDIKQVRLHGNVVDVTCCVEGAYVAATDSLNVAWIKDGAIVRQIGPFLPDAASAPARVGIVGDDTIVSMVGRVFTWTRDGFFVQPDFFSGEEITRSVQGNDTLVVLRSRGWLEFHRFPTNGGLAVESALIGHADWAIIDATLEAQGDVRVFIGRRHGRMVAAFVPPGGEATIVRGPMVGITGHPVIAPRGDGLHFAVWNLDNQIAEIDVSTNTLVGSHTIEGARPTSVQLTWAGDRWKVLDEAGTERTLRVIERSVSQSELLR